jgi:hypothetical protein
VSKVRQIAIANGWTVYQPDTYRFGAVALGWM